MAIMAKPATTIPHHTNTALKAVLAALLVAALGIAAWLLFDAIATSLVTEDAVAPAQSVAAQPASAGSLNIDQSADLSAAELTWIYGGYRTTAPQLSVADEIAAMRGSSAYSPRVPSVNEELSMLNRAAVPVDLCQVAANTTVEQAGIC